MTFLPPAGVTTMPVLSAPTGGITTSGNNTATLASAGTVTMTWISDVVALTYDGTNLTIATANATPPNPIVFDAGEQYLITLTFSDFIGSDSYRTVFEAYMDGLKDMNGTPQPSAFVLAQDIRNGLGTGHSGRQASDTLVATVDCTEDVTLNIVPASVGANLSVLRIGVVDNGPIPAQAVATIGGGTPSVAVTMGDLVRVTFSQSGSSKRRRRRYLRSPRAITWPTTRGCSTPAKSPATSRR